jgi:hypothetical protein
MADAAQDRNHSGRETAIIASHAIPKRSIRIGFAQAAAFA